MTTLQDSLQTLSRLNAPPSFTRRMLAYLHSGEILRSFLPKLLRTSAVTLLVVYGLVWIFLWPTVYREFERWGLVRAFFAQLITIATVFLVARVTMIRAGHMEVSPGDDFVPLRAMSLLCRWLAEAAVILVLGMALATILQPLSAIAMWLAPSEEGSGGFLLSILSGTAFLFAAYFVVPFFLLLYTFATAIDLAMAVEFNTRAERVARGQLQAGLVQS